VQVRGFAGWPGTWAKISISAEGKDDIKHDLKILRTELLSPEDCKEYASHRNQGTNQIGLCSEGLLLPCGDGDVLLATDVQAPGKQACCAAAFGNGHHGKRMFLER
jgi:methionyl-tRNA formyltransferase